MLAVSPAWRGGGLAALPSGERRQSLPPPPASALCKSWVREERRGVFTSSHACAHVGTKAKTHQSAVQRRLRVVSWVFGEGAETEVKAAWPIRRAPSLRWHIPNGTCPSVPCLTFPVPSSTQSFRWRLSLSSLQLVLGSQGRAGNQRDAASVGFAA